MFSLAVKRDFVAQHFLIGGNWGAENQWHSHHYVVELQLQGHELNRHNYLVDIVDIENTFDKLVARFQDKTLNELPEFGDTNPSIELFARIFCQAFAGRIKAKNLTEIRIKIWENDIAWASYQITL